MVIHLASSIGFDGKVDIVSVGGTLVPGSSVPVDDAGGSLTVDGAVTIQEPLSVDDGGGSLTVDGAVTIQEPLSVDDGGGSLTVDQAAHDNLNANANIQVGDVDVANANPVPISDAGGSVTVDGAVTIQEPLSVDDGGGSLTVDQAAHDNLNANANIQVGDVDVAVGNPVPISDAGGSVTVDGAVTIQEPLSVDDGGGSLSVDDGGGSLTVDQATHDNLNANANIQVGNVDVAVGNPVPISDAGGSVTVDGAVTIQEPLSVDDGGGSLSVDDGGGSLTVDQAAHDNLNANANIQVGNVDVDDSNPVPVNIVAKKIKLTGSTDGKPIPITAFASPGNAIDLTAGLGAGEGFAYFLKASFVTQAASEEDAILTLEFGGTSVNEKMTFSIPLEDAIVIAIGETLYANALTIAAFVGTSGQQVNVTGWKELVLP